MTTSAPTTGNKPGVNDQVNAAVDIDHSAKPAGQCVDDPECTRPVKSQSLCDTHYQRRRRAGTWQRKERVLPLLECSVEGCTNDAVRKGHRLCEKHYGRLRRHGDLHREPPTPTGSCLQCGVATPGRSYCDVRCQARFIRGVSETPITCRMCGAQRLARADAEYCSKKCGRKATGLRLNYGLTPEEYHAILASQGHRCASCARSFSDSVVPHVDHCHATGRVRAILCIYCNLSLGKLREDVARILGLVDYLERSATLVIPHLPIQTQVGPGAPCRTCRRPIPAHKSSKTMFCGKACQSRAARLRLQYNITVEGFHWLFAVQEQRCASCNDGLTTQTAHLDHCHATVRARGILCESCNTSLGQLDEDPERIRALARYAETHCAIDESDAAVSATAAVEPPRELALAAAA